MKHFTRGADTLALADAGERAEVCERTSYIFKK
jgi:hypothetical protein